MHLRTAVSSCQVKRLIIMFMWQMSVTFWLIVPVLFLSNSANASCAKLNLLLMTRGLQTLHLPSRTRYRVVSVSMSRVTCVTCDEYCDQPGQSPETWDQLTRGWGDAMILIQTRGRPPVFRVQGVYIQSTCHMLASATNREADLNNNLFRPIYLPQCIL